MTYSKYLLKTLFTMVSGSGHVTLTLAALFGVSPNFLTY